MLTRLRGEIADRMHQLNHLYAKNDGDGNDRMLLTRMINDLGVGDDRATTEAIELWRHRQQGMNLASVVESSNQPFHRRVELVTEGVLAQHKMDMNAARSGQAEQAELVQQQDEAEQADGVKLAEVRSTIAAAFNGDINERTTVEPGALDTAGIFEDVSAETEREPGSLSANQTSLRDLFK
jgi:hypothetical protein